MAEFNPNPRLNAAQEAAVQRRVTQEWNQARASGNPALYFAKSVGDWFPAGYNVDANGRLKYVQTRGSWASGMVSNPKLMIPLVASGGLAAAAALPAGATASAAGGGSAAGEAGLLASHNIGTGMATTMPSLAAGATGVAGATGGANAVINAAKTAAGTTSDPNSTFAEIMKQIAPYLTAGLTGVAALRGSDLQTDEQKQTQREMTEILAEQKRRMLGQSGLSDAVTQLAMGLLPTRYQR